MRPRQGGADAAGGAGNQDGLGSHLMARLEGEMRQLLPIKSGPPRLWCPAFTRESRVSESVSIVPVQTKAQWRDFHHLPFKIYRDDPHWVAPLLLERHFHFQPKHNPYFQHARAAFFLAYRGAEPVGRITAQVDQ